MKNIDYSQLLFAAEVHKLAIARYRAAHDRASCAPGMNIYEWERKNPFSVFETSALQSFMSTATTIAEHIDAAQAAIGRKSGG